MAQKIIRVGNSYAVTIPQSFAQEAGLKLGDQVVVNGNAVSQTLTITKAHRKKVAKSQTEEVEAWLEKFNKKYKKGLAELAKK